MDKKTTSIILVIILLGAFFLPYVSINSAYGQIRISGFEVVFGKGGQSGISSGKFMFATLLVPIGAILILFSVLGERTSTLADYVYWMPLIGIVINTIFMFLEMKKGATLVGGTLDFGTFLKAMGYAYWLTVAASIGVLVNKNRT